MEKNSTRNNRVEIHNEKILKRIEFQAGVTLTMLHASCSSLHMWDTHSSLSPSPTNTSRYESTLAKKKHYHIHIKS
ncbi:hypothetical protein EYC80_009516 [Monilinia laxa]|uniref:Uncharacterized protein n=1 Tax=Monilinia laxa TaxID=61186 RepID=A0A5N6JYH3_MONLA|nr:hypothetical protein EYC80_009516 [Monilinia laxa]